jgi:hypothetical protein
VEEVEEEAKVAVSVAQSNGLKSHMFADEEKERDALWHARRSAYYASAKYRNDVRRKPCIPMHIPSQLTHSFYLECMWNVQFGRHQMRLWVTDVCVPLSHLAQVISETEADFAQSAVKLPCPIVGHVADGNFHCLVPFNSTDPFEVAEMRRLNERLVQRALAFEGTASGEHGVGMGKIDALYQVRCACACLRGCGCVRACVRVRVRWCVRVGVICELMYCCAGTWRGGGAGDGRHQASTRSAHDHEPQEALPPRELSLFIGRHSFLIILFTTPTALCHAYCHLKRLP